MISKISTAKKIAQRYLTARLLDDVLHGVDPATIDPVDIVSGAENLSEEMGNILLDLVKMVPQWRPFEKKFTFLAIKHPNNYSGFVKEARPYFRELQVLTMKITESDFTRWFMANYDMGEVRTHLESELASQGKAGVSLPEDSFLAKAMYLVARSVQSKTILKHIFESSSFFSERYKKDSAQEISDFFDADPLSFRDAKEIIAPALKSAQGAVLSLISDLNALNTEQGALTMEEVDERFEDYIAAMKSAYSEEIASQGVEQALIERLREGLNLDLSEGSLENRFMGRARTLARERISLAVSEKLSVLLSSEVNPTKRQMENLVRRQDKKFSRSRRLS